MKGIVVLTLIRILLTITIATLFILFTLLYTLIVVGIFMVFLVVVIAEWFYANNLLILGTISIVVSIVIGLLVFIGTVIYLIVPGIRWVIRLVSKKRPEKHSKFNKQISTE